MGFTVDDATAYATFPADTGIPKTRKRSTLKRRLFSTPMEINGEQLEDFEQFWSDLNDGIDEFTWKDPTTGTACNFVFQRGANGPKKPRWQIISGGALGGAGGKTTYQLRRYSGLVELEFTGNAE